MYKFDEAIACEAVSDTHWRASIPEGWRIGAVPNGGLVLAMAGNVLRQALPHADPLTVHILFVAPTILGPVDCEVIPLREGGSTTHAQLLLRQEGEVRAAVSASYTDLGRLDGESWSPVERPTIDACEAVPATREHGIELRSSVDMHYVTGGEVFRRQEPDGSGCFNGWLKFADGRPTDLMSLLLFADAMAPPVFTVFGPLHWVPTVDLSVQLRAHPAPGPVQVRFRSRYMTDGLVEEDGEIWDSEGRLVAVSRGCSKVRVKPR